MSRAYIFLADGFEEIEGLTVVDILRRGGVDITTVSITGSDHVTGSHNIALHADALFEQTDFSDAQALILPGGMPGTLRLGEHEALGKLLRQGKEKGTWLCAICAAPSVLGDLGLAEGEKVTSYPGFEARMTGAQYMQEEVVISGKMITSRGMGTAIAFALAILSKLADEQTAEKIGKSIIWRQ